MLEKTAFNAPDGQPYQLVQLTNSNGMTVQFMDWGATWLSCKVPVNGELREVLLGCKVEDYPHQTAYLGASVGRYANRIANAQFELGERTIQLVANQGNHQLHGGKEALINAVGKWKSAVRILCVFPLYLPMVIKVLKVMCSYCDLHADR